MQIVLFGIYIYLHNKRVPGTDPKQMVSYPKLEPKSTNYLLGKEFNHSKDPNPIESYRTRPEHPKSYA